MTRKCQFIIIVTTASHNTIRAVIPLRNAVKWRIWARVHSFATFISDIDTSVRNDNIAAKSFSSISYNNPLYLTNLLYNNTPLLSRCEWQVSILWRRNSKKLPQSKKQPPKKIKYVRSTKLYSFSLSIYISSNSSRGGEKVEK